MLNYWIQVYYNHGQICMELTFQEKTWKWLWIFFLVELAHSQLWLVAILNSWPKFHYVNVISILILSMALMAYFNCKCTFIAEFNDSFIFVFTEGSGIQPDNIQIQSPLKCQMMITVGRVFWVWDLVFAGSTWIVSWLWSPCHVSWWCWSCPTSLQPSIPG